MKHTLNFQDYIKKHLSVIERLSEVESMIHHASEILIDALSKGNKIIFCGNGGSAADSQHLAAEFMGRFLTDRNPLPAIALTVDTSALTAIGNDYGYEQIFSRQLKGISQKGDVLIGITTSGKSNNVIKALSVAGELNLRTIALTGTISKEYEINNLSEIVIAVPSDKTNFIQEAHILIGHYLCGIVEHHFLESSNNN